MSVYAHHNTNEFRVDESYTPKRLNAIVIFVLPVSRRVGIRKYLDWTRNRFPQMVFFSPVFNVLVLFAHTVDCGVVFNRPCKICAKIQKTTNHAFTVKND